MIRQSVRKTVGVAALGLLLAVAGSAQAGPISVAPIQANVLQSISGGGYSHNHGDLSVLFGLDLRINGVWTNVLSWTQDSADHLLSHRTSGGPITFAGGTVDGIRLTDNPSVGNAYHGMFGSSYASGVTTFTFDSVTSAVPEPATLASLGLGVVTLAGYDWRRRRRVVATA